MKKLMILLAGLWSGYLLSAQTQGVVFRDLSYEQALQQAKAENKLVFMDCYTDWCGACQHMNKVVFTTAEAGSFLNPNFICIKMNLGKGDGKRLAKQCWVTAYPTYFLLRPDGSEQHRIVGSKPWDDFRERLGRGMNLKSSFSYLKECDQKGKLSPKQENLLRLALGDAGEKKQAKYWADRQFFRLSDKQKCQPENWYIYEQLEVGPTDPCFAYLVAHKSDFDKTIGREKVDAQLTAGYVRALENVKMGHGSQTKVDSVLWKVGEYLAVSAFTGKEKVTTYFDYVKAWQKKDQEGMRIALQEGMPHFSILFLCTVVVDLDELEKMATPEEIKEWLSLEAAMTQQMKTEESRKLVAGRFGHLRNVVRNRTCFAEIRGQVWKDNMPEVKLFEVVDGKEKLLSATKVGQDGLYGFVFQPSRNGYYTLGGKYATDKIRVYLEPGNRAEVNIWEDSLALTSENTMENKLLSQWEAMFFPVRQRLENTRFALFDYKEFYPYFVAFLPKARAFQETIRSRNARFDTLLRQTVDFDLDYCAFKILNALKASKETHKPSRPAPADYPDYYKTLVSKEKLSDAAILEQPYGYDFLQRYTTFALKSEQKPETLPNRLEWLSEPLLRAEIVLLYMEHCRSYEDYLKLVETYEKYLTTPNHQERKDAVSAKLYQGMRGGIAADFTYPDRNGKMVSLSDFKGKVVVVDVWATWCGPCRAEIPHLVKLEKEMEGKEVVFIGVSVDQKKDHQKWLEVLDQEGLGGVQLFASGMNQITKDYKITGIPRFMVFDREGKVVTTKSPRPSSPELKKLLEKMLR